MEKTELLKFRATPEELLAVDEAAYRLKVSRSEYLRQKVFDKRSILVDLSPLHEVSGQLGKIGVNINQIAKKLNQGGDLEQEDATMLKDSMEHINGIVVKLYKDTMLAMKGG